MLTTLEGVMGSGKSLTSVALAWSDWLREQKVIANNHLKFPYTHFDLSYFVEHISDEHLANCTLLLDEAYLYLDARTSSAKLNKLFTYFVAQTRKRGVDMYICVHHIDTLDKRLRRAVDVRGTCRYTKEDPCKGCKGTGLVNGKKKGLCSFCMGRGFDVSTLQMCEHCEGTKVGNACGRCNGYGKSGWARTTLYNKNTGERRRLTIKGPAFWDLYATEELVPLSQKQRRIATDDL